jgi:hypothetical protein
MAMASILGTWPLRENQKVTRSELYTARRSWGDQIFINLTKVAKDTRISYKLKEECKRKKQWSYTSGWPSLPPSLGIK